MIKLLPLAFFVIQATTANAEVSPEIYQGVNHQVITASTGALIDVVMIDQKANVVVNIISSSSTTDSAQYDFKASGSYTITDYYYHIKPVKR